MCFFIHFSPEKTEPRLTHNLSILSSFILRKMWVMDSLQGKGGIYALSKAGEGEGQGGEVFPRCSLLTHHFKLDVPVVLYF